MMDKIQVGILCKKAADVETTCVDADVVINPLTIDQETRIVSMNVVEILRFKDGGLKALQIYISSLEAVANAVINRRQVNSSLKGKATMHDGLQQMRATEEAMQLAVDKLLDIR